MKFGEQLELNTFPQWSQYYVRYRQIKNHINALFPTPSEIEKKDARDRAKATQSLLTLTDPERARLLQAQPASAQDEASTPAPSDSDRSARAPESSPSPDLSDDSNDGTALLPVAKVLQAHDDMRAQTSAGAGTSALADAPRNETLAFNIHSKSYGGLDHDDVSSDEDEGHHGSNGLTQPAGAMDAGSETQLQVRINGLPLSKKNSASAGDIASAISASAESPAASPPISRPDSPVRFNSGLPPRRPSAVTASTSTPSSLRPHMARRVSGGDADGLVLSSKRFHPLAPTSHLEKMDQIIVKIMGELQKIDEFHRLMEAKILAAFAGLKAQVNAAREGDTAPEGISRKLKEMRHAAHAQSKMAISHSSGSLSKMGSSKDGSGSHTPSHEEKEPLTGRSSPNSGEEHHHHHQQHHSLGHVRYHSTAMGRGHAHTNARERERERNDSSSGSAHSDHHGIDSIPLKAAFSQLLRRATMLIHFVDINYVAFAKLLKCFEKRAMGALKAGREGSDPELVAHASRMHKQLLTTMQSRRFYTSRQVDAEVVPELYKLYGDLYEGGNIERAKLILLANLTEQQYSRRDSFWLGLKLGCICMLLCVLLVILIRPLESLALVQNMQVFSPVYRCVGLLIVFLWLWSFLVQAWDAFGIPYVLIFQLNPRTRLTHFQLQVEASNLTIVYLLNSLLFLTHSGRMLSEKFSLAIYPCALFLFVLVKLFSPWRRISHWATRATLLHTLGQILTAPLGKTRFMDGFVADILTSMVKVFVDVEASICLVSTYFFMERTQAAASCAEAARYIVPFICALPLWWRFLQCLRRYYDSGERWPHVANAFKYLLTHSVVIMAAFHPVFTSHHDTSWQTYRCVWLICCALSTLYSTWWDLVMDWGLFQPGAPWPLLRKELLFGEGNVAFYYFAIVSNCVLRWIWVVTIIPFSFEESRESHSPTSILTALVSWDLVIIPVLALLELLRRFQWGLLRVEYEQVAQGAKLRVDPHLPIYLQQVQKSSAQKKEEAQHDYGVMSEVIGMALCLIVIAVIAALA